MKIPDTEICICVWFMHFFYHYQPTQAFARVNTFTSKKGMSKRLLQLQGKVR